MLDPLWQGLLWGLDSLGKPGRAARGVIHGLTDIAQGETPDWKGGLLHAIPFSDTLGITNSEEGATGWDLARNWNLYENQPGIDPTDIASFAIDVATDPLSWIGAPLARAGARGIQSLRGARAAKALPAAEPVAQIAEEGRSLVPVANRMQPSPIGPTITPDVIPLPGPQPLALPAPIPPIYSRLQRAAESLPGKQFKSQSLPNMLKKAPGGVADEEMEWVLKGMPSKGGVVSKEELLKHIDENAIRVEEKMLETTAKPGTYDVVDIYPGGDRVVIGNGLSRGEAEQMLAARRAHLESMGDVAGYAPPQTVEMTATGGGGAHLGGEFAAASEPKWSQCATPGGSNYRELLLKLPQQRANPSALRLKHLEDQRLGSSLSDAEWDELRQLRNQVGTRDWSDAQTAAGVYKSTHWEGDDNVLAHIRFDERVAPDGGRTLFLQEVQSDWHQAGAKQGYKNKPLPSPEWVAGKSGTKDVWRSQIDDVHLTVYKTPEGQYLLSSNWSELGGDEFATLKDAQRFAESRVTRNDTRIPDAPFKGTAWAELALKKMLTYAKNNGFDRIAWNNGDLAAKHVAGGATGKAASGIAKWYDETMPTLMQKLLKKHKVTMEPFPLEVDGVERIVPSFRVPQSAKREMAEKGLPLLSLLPLGLLPLAGRGEG